MISISEISKLAVRSLLRNKTRSLLTMIGVIIGVSAVISLVSIGQGLQNYINSQFESLGSNVIAVLPGKVGDSSGSFSGGSIPNITGTKLTMKDVSDIAKLGGSIESVGAAIQSAASVSYQGKTRYTTILGLDAEYPKIRNLSVDSGRQITNTDIKSDKNVAVIGTTIVDKLFSGSNPIGKQIKIGGQKFEVVGVLKEIGSGGFGVDTNSYAIIPITSAQSVFGIKGVQTIAVKATDKESITPAINQVKKLLSKHLEDDDFSVIDQGSLIQTINQILGVITVALGGIAAISLVVGGVGIMNIMLVSVTERTREIGLRKAVGAKPQDILVQFLIEAVILSLGGGVIGIILGEIGAWLMGRFIETSVSLWSIALAFGVSALIGIIFGVAPAARAAKLSPIEALKYE